MTETRWQKSQICTQAFITDEQFYQMGVHLHICEDSGAIASSPALSNDAESCPQWSHIVELQWIIFSKCGKA